MAIKRTINSVAPIKTTQIKAPNLKKAVVLGIKKDELTIKPQEEIIEEVESVTEIPTPLIPDIIVQEPILDISTAGSPSVDFETETKLAKEKVFGRFFLCLGIILLVLMILNKK